MQNLKTTVQVWISGPWAVLSQNSSKKNQFSRYFIILLLFTWLVRCFCFGGCGIWIQTDLYRKRICINSVGWITIILNIFWKVSFYEMILGLGFTNPWFIFIMFLISPLRKDFYSYFDQFYELRLYFLLKGSDGRSQLKEIFRVLGTPRESSWPGVSQSTVYQVDW